MSKILKSISATSITTYEECPLKWKYQYIYKLLQLPNDAFIIGIAYHKALQFYHQLPAENTKEKIIKQLKNEMLIKKTDDEIKRFSLVRKMFEKYIENPVLGNIIEKEFNFNVTLPGLPVKLYGFVDRVDEDFIIEYKTTSEDYTQERIDNLQSKIYTYAVLKTKGKLLPVKYSINNKKKVDKKEYKPQVLTIQYNQDDMKKLEQKCLEFYNQIQHSEFKHRQGSHCYYCPFGSKGTDNCPYSL